MNEKSPNSIKTELPNPVELEEFIVEFDQESDKGMVLTAGGYLELRLKETLLAFLTKTKESTELVKYNGPLGSLYARIHACYALGLIDEQEFTSLILVKDIRNKFAHTWKNVSFDDHTINELCKKLPWLGALEDESKSSSRERFQFFVVCILMDLLYRQRDMSTDTEIHKCVIPKFISSEKPSSSIPKLISLMKDKDFEEKIEKLKEMTRPSKT